MSSSAFRLFHDDPEIGVGNDKPKLFSQSLNMTADDALGCALALREVFRAAPASGFFQLTVRNKRIVRDMLQDTIQNSGPDTPGFNLIESGISIFSYGLPFDS